MQLAQSCRHSSPSMAGSVCVKRAEEVGIVWKSAGVVGLLLLVLLGAGEFVRGEGVGLGVKREVPRRRSDCIVVVDELLMLSS